MGPKPLRINEGSVQNLFSLAVRLTLSRAEIRKISLPVGEFASMYRAFLLAAPLLLIPVSLPSTPVDGTAAAQSRTGENCQRRNETRRRGGAVLGGIARGVLGRVGGGSVANTVAPMSSMLGDAIMNMLDCREQEQAASATEEAVRGGNVGATATWESASRPNVSGSSTVTAADTSGGEDCMMVTDVVIVDGQEASEEKRLCRRPPSNRYVRV
jgi:surface antigen